MSMQPNTQKPFKAVKTYNILMDVKGITEYINYLTKDSTPEKPLIEHVIEIVCEHDPKLMSYIIETVTPKNHIFKNYPIGGYIWVDDMGSWKSVKILGNNLYAGVVFVSMNEKTVEYKLATLNEWQELKATMSIID